MMDLMVIALLFGLGYLTIQAGQALLSAGIGVVLGVLFSDALNNIIQYLLE